MSPDPDANRSAASPASLLRAALLGLAYAVGATAARWLLGLMAPSMAPCALVFPAAILATLSGGLGPGLVTAIIGLALSDYLFMTPRFSMTTIDKNDIVTY